jgi:hypothetical protein
MATEKIYTFDYTLKTIVDGKEEKIKKTGEAKAMYFDSIADAIAYYESKEAGKGEQTVLDELNGSLKATATANARANLTRIPTIPKSIREKAEEKLDDNEKAQFNAIMLKLGVSTLKS